MRAFNGLSVLVDHPAIGIAVFVVVSLGVIALLSEGRLMDALKNLMRVFVTFFTTPFVFLRDALATVRTAGEEEEQYKRTRVFMLFRYSRLQYLGILVVSLLLLSSGITASLVSLWPQAELEQHKRYSEDIRSIQERIEATERTKAEASDPNRKAALEKARNDAKAAFDTEAQATGAALASTTFSGGIINRLARARGIETVTRITGDIDQYMADCPNGYSWRGFTPEACGEFRTFVTDLAARKLKEQQLAEAYATAEAAFLRADSAAADAEDTLTALRADLASTKQARDRVSVLNPEVIGGKLLSAGGLLIATLLTVIIFVWLGAILIDVLNWFILLMRSLEKEHAARLRDGGPGTTGG